MKHLAPCGDQLARRAHCHSYCDVYTANASEKFFPNLNGDEALVCVCDSRSYPKMKRFSTVVVKDCSPVDLARI